MTTLSGDDINIPTYTLQYWILISCQQCFSSHFRDNKVHRNTSCVINNYVETTGTTQHRIVLLSQNHFWWNFYNSLTIYKSIFNKPTLFINLSVQSAINGLLFSLFDCQPKVDNTFVIYFNLRHTKEYAYSHTLPLR